MPSFSSKKPKASSEKHSYDFLMPPDNHRRIIGLFVLVLVAGVAALGTWLYANYTVMQSPGRFASGDGSGPHGPIVISDAEATWLNTRVTTTVPHVTVTDTQASALQSGRADASAKNVIQLPFNNPALSKRVH